MANKQSFTPEEWTKILESTMLAGMAVSAACKSATPRRLPWATSQRHWALAHNPKAVA